MKLKEIYTLSIAIETIAKITHTDSEDIIESLEGHIISEEEGGKVKEFLSDNND